MHRTPQWKHSLRRLLLTPLLLGLFPGCDAGEERPEQATRPPPAQSALLTTAPTPMQVVLDAEADTMVSSLLPGTNYGTLTGLTVDRYSETYLRFNLSSIPAGARIASVMLQAQAYSGESPGGDGSVYTHLVPDDSWSETGMHWYNKPAVSGSDLGSWWLWYSTSATKPLQVGLNYSPKLKAPVQQAVDSDGKISFRLRSPGYKTVYRSREYSVASERPKLIISYFEASDPQVTADLQVVDLSPAADAQVLAASPNSNYGTSSILTVDRSEAETFLRFNLSGIPTNAKVASVVLVTTSYDGYAYDGADGNVYTHLVPNDTWSETGITWNTKPAVKGSDLGSWLLWNRNGQYTTQMGINSNPKLVTAVQQELGLDGVISLRLNSPGYRTLYRSREYTNTAVSWPHLLVYYFIPPPPPPCPVSNAPAPTQVVLEPEADAYVSALNPGTNLGTAGNLIVSPGEEETYLRFNLSSIPAGARIASVMLQTQAYGGYAYGGDGSVYTYLVPDDSWSETGITWNTKPAASGNDLGSWWLWYGNAAPLQVGLNYDPKLKAPVQQALDSDQRISFRLASSGYKTVYRSREYSVANERPKLIISYFDATNPQVTADLQAVALFPSADAQVLASNPNSNYGTSSILTVDRSEAETFLRFSLASIPANAQVASVVLVSTSHDGTAYDGADGNVYTDLVSDDTWSETAITWNTKPASNQCDLGSWLLWNRDGQYATQVGINSSPKLVAPVQQALGSDGLITLRLNSPGYRTLYHSREYTETTARWPQLLVYYTLPSSVH
ncbi:DUF7594 domain-containing protein [Hyalangium minutum]|uniref:Carbohydrate-binding module family 96 domain-containing protein n=1 Tax=Hyalangium minutum TaxID=394096 RepID=A0A085WPP0_9BACT|nr:DNRLRE domain-containing protein [Hyalangium minutum]KFE69653.1 hypothetical protein DB31_6628 [Hyalangium minutum]